MYKINKIIITHLKLLYIYNFLDYRNCKIIKLQTIIDRETEIKFIGMH